MNECLFTYLYITSIYDWLIIDSHYVSDENEEGPNVDIALSTSPNNIKTINLGRPRKPMAKKGVCI